jgi:diguanylate cyclase (GGDEF)-like protein
MSSFVLIVSFVVPRFWFRLSGLGHVMKMGNITRIGLAAKFNLLSISLILATSIGICFFMVRLEVSGYYAELLSHGKTIADTTSKNCEYGVYTEDRTSLLPVLDGLSSDSDIAYVSVLNLEGRVLENRVFQEATEMPPFPFGDIGQAKTVAARDVTDARHERQYLEILYPVLGSSGGTTDVLLPGGSLRPATKIIGYLRLGLTQDSLRRRIRQLLVSTVLVTTVIVLFGSLLSVFLSKRITSPIHRLKTAIRDVADGKFDTSLDIRSHDEIADLARSFEHMRGSLRDYHSQVEERTAELTASNDMLRKEVGARITTEKQMLHDALHDSLTGLPNRELFVDRLTHTIGIAKRRKDYLYAVLILDIDRFKVINDSLGHVAGDQLLIAIGQRLIACVRPGDTVVRLGGDEFAILLEDISGLGNAVYIAERISTALAAPFTVAGGQEVFAAASIGIALSAAEYDHSEKVLRDADTAMYQAKSSSNARYAVFEPGMHANALERLRLETELRRAVERKEFIVYYQPIVSLNRNSLSGYEALVRWRHPERGVLNPGDFIQMAEETGMIVSIDRLVMRESCRQMQEWHGQVSGNGNGRAFISVNLSHKQMVQPDLVAHVEEVLRETGLDPGSLKLEITENVIIENPEEAIAMLGRLKALGVRLYIDDFGTGYSSLSYLHRLPIDGLKIDRSFIKNMGENGENQQIVRTIMLLARDLNIAVIAEGVETAHQLSLIKSMHCEFGQGYLFSKPVDGSHALAYLKEGLLH